MDFLEILKVAAENQGDKVVRKTGYSTDLGKPKRVKNDKPKGVNSSAVQAFLKKKEQEDKKKAAEEKRKKIELMKLRAEQNTLGKMNNIIKRNHTKEAIFNVEGDGETGADGAGKSGVNADNQEDECSFTRLKCETGAGKRRAALSNVKRIQIDPNYIPKEERERLKEEEKKSGSSDKSKHSDRSKSKSSHSSSSKHHSSCENHSSNHSKPDEKPKPAVKKKNRPPAPPPMSYSQLLKLAEEKKTEAPAVNSEQKPKKEKEPTQGRPLTQEEKDRLERIKSKEYLYWLKTGKSHPDTDIGVTKSNGAKSSSKTKSSEQISSAESSPRDIPSKKPNSVTDKIKSVPSSSSSSSSSGSPIDRPHSSGTKVTTSSHHKSGSHSPVTTGSQKTTPKVPPSAKSSTQLSRKPSCSKVTTSTRSSSSQSHKGSQSKPGSRPGGGPGGAPRGGGGGGKAGGSRYAEEHENVLVCGQGGRRGSADSREEEGEEDEGPQLSTLDHIYGSIKKKQQLKPGMRELLKKKRAIESDDEDEYDEGDNFIDDDASDMGDFIDDTDAGAVSKEIAAIFGYNRNKYRHMDDDDDECMEVGFAQVEREEKISARIGLKEDLEDIRREEEELQQKALLKKQRAKKMKTR